MTLSLFQRIQGLIELIAGDPLRAHLLSYLSRELSPSGRPSAVLFGQLSRDGVLHIVSHDGFHGFDPEKISEITIESNRATSRALRSARLTILSQDEIRPFQHDLPKELSTQWNSAAAIPIGLQSIYLIQFPEDVTRIREFEEFLHCISSLLITFEWGQESKAGRRRGLWFDEKSNTLSIREQKIVELIRQGLTNGEIATSLGYSESLIRQETVAIYRKLGVSGRKELRSSESTPKRAARNAMRAAISLAGVEVLTPLLQNFESSIKFFA